MIGPLELREALLPYQPELLYMKTVVLLILPCRSYTILVEFVEKASLPQTAVILQYRNLQPGDVCLLLSENKVKATYHLCKVVKISTLLSRAAIDNQPVGIKSQADVHEDRGAADTSLQELHDPGGVCGESEPSLHCRLTTIQEPAAR